MKSEEEKILLRKHPAYAECRAFWESEIGRAIIANARNDRVNTTTITIQEPKTNIEMGVNNEDHAKQS